MAEAVHKMTLHKAIRLDTANKLLRGLSEKQGYFRIQLNKITHDCIDD